MGRHNLPGRVMLEFTGHISQTIDANVADKFIQFDLWFQGMGNVAKMLQCLYILGGSETGGFKHTSGRKYVDNFTKVLPI